MLGGDGYYRGSTVLVSGTAGSGKSSLASHFANATCQRGERCLYLSFEESPLQITRNMRAVGVELQPWVDRGLLRFASSRPTAHGLETHLALIHSMVRDFKPSAIILDPASNFAASGGGSEAHKMLIRLVDYLKGEGITAVMTSLTAGGAALEETETAVSSVVDTWLLVKAFELNGERNRGLYVLKSRGMAHSNQVREFLITSRGIELLDVYVGAGGVLTGSARANQEAADRRASLLRDQEITQKRRLLERRQALHREQLAKLEAEFEAETFELQNALSVLETADEQTALDRARMATLRRADAAEAADQKLGGKA
jgi:circadian clock protein KaiC